MYVETGSNVQWVKGQEWQVPGLNFSLPLSGWSCSDPHACSSPEQTQSACMWAKGMWISSMPFWPSTAIDTWQSWSRKIGKPNLTFPCCWPATSKAKVAILYMPNMYPSPSGRSFTQWRVKSKELNYSTALHASLSPIYTRPSSFPFLYLHISPHWLFERPHVFPPTHVSPTHCNCTLPI